MLQVITSSQFKKDIKRLQKQRLDMEKLKRVIILLSEQAAISEKHRDHQLKGNWSGYRELHIEPDWLLIYVVTGDELRLATTGSHADLYGK